MENVPEVIGKKNIKHFAEWVKFLDGLGYKSKWDLVNAKDFGVPQNRNRCFMVSVLGDYYYHFPQGKPLEKRLKDLLEDKVDEKYYLKDRTIEMFINHTEKQSAKGNGFKFEPTTGGGYAHSVLTRNGERPCDNFIISPSEKNRERNRDCDHLNGERLQRVWQSSNDRSNRVEIISRPHGYNKGGITQSEVYPTVRKSSTEQGNNGIIEKWQI